MPINLADLPLQAIGLLAGLTFVASLIGNSLTKNAFVGAIITVIIFVAVYVAWDFYPHGYLPGCAVPVQVLTRLLGGHNRCGAGDCEASSWRWQP